MNPGRLKHRITIQAQSDTAYSELGQPTENFTTQATVWGEIIPMSGREAYYAKQVQPDVTHKITIRGGQTVTPKHRLSHESRIFNVLSSTREDERTRYMIIMAQESV